MGFKIKCCDNTDRHSSQSHILEKTILEETIQELTESSQMHESYWRKIKVNHEKFVEEATEREQEFNDIIRKQSDQIRKSYNEIKKLQDNISQLISRTWNSRTTQTDHYDRTENSKHSEEIGTQTDKRQEREDFSLKLKLVQKNKRSLIQKTVEPSEYQIDNILIVAGHHGKNLVSFIINCMSRFTATSIIKPHAQSREIIESAVSSSKNFSKRDVVVLWPSNINTSHFNDLHSRLQHTNFIILSTPYRYDKPIHNEKIYYGNLALNRMVHLATGNLKQVINVNAILRKSNYCKVSNCIKNTGKKYIAKYIVQNIKEIILCKTMLNQTSDDIEDKILGKKIMCKSINAEHCQNPTYDADINNQMHAEGNGHFLYPRLTQTDFQE